MTIANLNEKFNLTKKVKFIEKPYLGKQGLQILADVDGTEVFLEATPEETALILQDNGLIEEAYVGDRQVVVKWGWVMDTESFGEHEQKSKIQEIRWDDFVRDYTLTEFNAKQIIVNCILNAKQAA